MSPANSAPETVTRLLEMGRPAGEGLGGSVYRGRGAEVSEAAEAE